MKKITKLLDKKEKNGYTCNCLWEIQRMITGCGSAWLERLVWDQEVAGSNPVTPIGRLIIVMKIQ